MLGQKIRGGGMSENIDFFEIFDFFYLSREKTQKYVFACYLQIKISPGLFGVSGWDLNPFRNSDKNVILKSFPVHIIRISSPIIYSLEPRAQVGRDSGTENRDFRKFWFFPDFSNFSISNVFDSEKKSKMFFDMFFFAQDFFCDSVWLSSM